MNGKQLDDTRAVIESGDRAAIETFNRAQQDAMLTLGTPAPLADINREDWSQWKGKGK